MCASLRKQNSAGSQHSRLTMQKIASSNQSAFLSLQNSQLSTTELLCCPRLSILNSFRFEEENEHEYEI